LVALAALELAVVAWIAVALAWRALLKEIARFTSSADGRHNNVKGRP
jgi:hypothetical protein